MSAFYNEIDPYAAQWLRNLITAGHIAAGDVDTRSIEDVRPDDLRGYTQCHFFAGIGVWSHALRLAQWPDTRPVWTGSCPCQPFSVAGAGAGVLDERHLWPRWFWLIEQCRPPVIFGEQVEAAIGHGWLDLVQSDLEGINYAVGHAGVPAAGVGAPHIRQRLWFVADAEGLRQQGRPVRAAGWMPPHGASQDRQPDQLADANERAGRQGSADLRGWIDGGDAQPRAGSGSSSVPSQLGYAELVGTGRDTRTSACTEGGIGVRAERDGAGPSGAARELAHHHHQGPQRREPQPSRSEQPAGQRGGAAGALADDDNNRLNSTGAGGPIHAHVEQRSGDGSRLADTQSVHRREEQATNHIGAQADRPANQPGRCGGASFWSDADWLPCRDGKARPVEPGTFPLAHGAPARVGRLRAYGNAIVPQVAAEVISAFMECRP